MNNNQKGRTKVEMDVLWPNPPPSQGYLYTPETAQHVNGGMWSKEVRFI